MKTHVQLFGFKNDTKRRNFLLLQKHNIKEFEILHWSLLLKKKMCTLQLLNNQILMFCWNYFFNGNQILHAISTLVEFKDINTENNLNMKNKIVLWGKKIIFEWGPKQRLVFVSEIWDFLSKTTQKISIATSDLLGCDAVPLG